MDSPHYFRSCSPSESWWDDANEQPSSQLFRPTPKDNGKLSVAGNQWTTAKEFYEEYTLKLRLRSRGVWAVTRSDCQAIPVRYRDAQLEISLNVTEDFGEGRPRGHCLLHMEDYPPKVQKKIGVILRDRAVRHGCLYPDGAS